jgi:hypothetical protein
MGSRITREYWCDTCGYRSSDQHDFYHNHGKYTAGNSISILELRLRNAENEKEKFSELCDWFGFHPGEGLCNVRLAKYDENIIKCIIKGMREGMIHNEDATCECECSKWYKSAPDIADYIESKIPELKAAFNNMIDRAVVEEERRMQSDLNYLKSRTVP